MARRSMKKAENVESPAETLVQKQEEDRRSWECFFYCQRNPILRSEIITALMAGTPLQVDRLPNAVLLDAILLSTAARVFFQAEIVDDYSLLLERAEEEWSKPNWTSRVFDSTHARWANAIINHGTRDFESPDERYIPGLTKWYLEHDPPKYFSEELES